MTNPLIGSKMRLITKTEVRYEGELHAIDPVANTVTLQNVHSFGTEGRRDGPQIPHHIGVFPLLVFVKDDVKEADFITVPESDNKLQTNSNLSQNNKPRSRNMERDQPPIITANNLLDVSTNSDNIIAQQSYVNKCDSAGNWRDKRTDNESRDNRVFNGTQRQRYNNRNIQSQYRNNRIQRPGLPYGGIRPGNGRLAANEGQERFATENMKKEFDFSKMNSEFIKEVEFAKFEKDQSRDSASVENSEGTDALDTVFETPYSAYNKNSFFDTLGTDSSGLQLKRFPRKDGAVEHSLNTLTFGPAAVSTLPSTIQCRYYRNYDRSQRDHAYHHGDP